MRKDERNANVENAGRGNSAMDKAMYCHIIEAISDKADNMANPSMCDQCDYYVACQGIAAEELTAELCERLHIG